MYYGSYGNQVCLYVYKVAPGFRFWARTSEEKRSNMEDENGP